MAIYEMTSSHSCLEGFNCLTGVENLANQVSEVKQANQTPIRLCLILKTRHRVALVVTLAGGAIALLAFLCARDPKIKFLPRDGRAEWILFPTAVDARAHAIANLDTGFRRGC